MFRFLLYPVSLIYGLIVKTRNIFFDLGILKSEHFNIPVISIGNITVGGTGKTPHVEYLAKLLKGEFRVSVLSRGYKRKTRGFILARQDSTSKEIGDEPLQIKLKYPDIEVAVNEKRVDGIKKLIEQHVELIILDDAFQHRYVRPGLSILLIDFNRRIDHDYMLPFGNLRESENEKKRADILIITKTPLELKPIDRRIIVEQIKPAPYQEMYFTGIAYGRICPVFNIKSQIIDDFYQNHIIYTILLVTGIAFPKPLLENLKTYTQDIRHLQFADHSDYNKNKYEKIAKNFSAIENDKKIIITTEKDAIKMRENGATDEMVYRNLYFVPIEIRFIDKETEFNKQIIDYVRKNKRNS